MFGVTLHGSSHPFNSKLLASMATTLYKDENFCDAFKKISTPDMKIRRGDVFKVLELTFGMIPLVEEMLLFADRLNIPIEDNVLPLGTYMSSLNGTLKASANGDLDGPLSWEEFHEALADIRGFLESVRARGRSYTSFEELKEDRRRHIRRRVGPQDVFQVPMTAMQQVGWHEETVRNERHPNNSCEETRYKKEFVKSNWGAF